MIKSYILSSVLTVALFTVASTAKAGDIYLSSTGSDDNDGTTATTAYATLAKAVGAAKANDVIHVSGIITVSCPVTLTAKLTFKGSDPTKDGFNGQGSSQIMTNNTNVSANFSNLLFENGSATSNGGALSFVGGIFTIDNCAFKDNQVSTTAAAYGGAIFVQNATMTITNSSFEGNKGYYGGAMTAQSSGLKLTITNCTFKGNSAANNSNSAAKNNGGALQCLSSGSVVISGSTFDGNSSAGEGGAIALNDNVSSFTLKSSAIVNNTSKNNGAGILIRTNNGTTNAAYTIASTTIYNNSIQDNTTAGGSAIAVQGKGSTTGSLTQNLNIINCTITGNAAPGNVDFSALYASGQTITINVYNSIIDGNTSGTSSSTSPSQWADLNFYNTVANINNSLIGRIARGEASGANKATLTNSVHANLAGNTVDRTKLTSGYADMYGNSFPLKASSQCLTMGNLTLATNAGVTEDQFGQTWTKPFIGAVQLREYAVTNSKNYTSFYSAQAVKVPEGLTAHTYNGVSGSYLTEGTSYEAGSVIPAGTGVVFESTTDGDYTLGAAVSSETAPNDNMLYGSESAVLANTVMSGTGVYYILATVNDAKGFYRPSTGDTDGSFTTKANKAFLFVPGTSTAKGFSFGGNTTAIENIESVKSIDNNAPAYNLAGQRVSRNYRGIVVRGGKKFINK